MKKKEKEKFQELVERLENIGDELNNFLEEHENEEIETAMMGLRISIDEISELSTR